MQAAERELLEGLRAHRVEVCEAFVDTHYRALHRFFLWLTNSPDAAADLTQETFAAFWHSAAALDPDRAPDLKAWLYGIARNRWRKRCRDRGAPWVELEQASGIPDEAPGPEQSALAALEADRVARAVADLPPDYREALLLRVFEELTYAQAAEVLEISPELARWRVHRARQQLRKALEQDELPQRDTSRSIPVPPSPVPNA